MEAISSTKSDPAKSSAVCSCMLVLKFSVFCQSIWQWLLIPCRTKVLRFTCVHVSLWAYLHARSVRKFQFGISEKAVELKRRNYSCANSTYPGTVSIYVLSNAHSTKSVVLTYSWSAQNLNRRKLTMGNYVSFVENTFILPCENIQRLGKSHSCWEQVYAKEAQ